MRMLGVLLILLALMLMFVKIDISSPDDGPIDVNIPIACEPFIDQISRTNISSYDATELSKFYKELAKMVESDIADSDQMILTSSNARLLNRCCGEIRFAKTSVFKRYPKLAELIDDTIAAAVGSKKDRKGGYENVTLDKTKKQNLADAFRGIAAAVRR